MRNGLFNDFYKLTTMLIDLSEAAINKCKLPSSGLF